MDTAPQVNIPPISPLLPKPPTPPMPPMAPKAPVTPLALPKPKRPNVIVLVAGVAIVLVIAGGLLAYKFLYPSATPTELPPTASPASPAAKENNRPFLSLTRTESSGSGSNTASESASPSATNTH